MEELQESWRRISQWLRQNNPVGLSHLNDPASNANISDVEKRCGLEFTPGLRSWYQLHDGENGDWPRGLLDSEQRWLPLAEAEGIWTRSMKKANLPQGEWDFPYWKQRCEKQEIFVKGPVKPLKASPKWFPLMEGDGSLRLMDFDPAPGGKVGQIIEVDQELGIHQVLADSLEDYLYQYAEKLQQGAFYVEEEQILPMDEDEISDWPLPEWLSEVPIETVTLDQVSQPSVMRNVKDEVEVIACMSYVADMEGEKEFDLVLQGGKDVSVVARAGETLGYDSIADEQYARVRLRPIDHVDDDEDDHSDTEFFVQHYTWIRGPKELIEPEYEKISRLKIVLYHSVFFLLGIMWVLVSLFSKLVNFSKMLKWLGAPPDQIRLLEENSSTWQEYPQCKEFIGQLESLDLRKGKSFRIVGIKHMSLLSFYGEDVMAVLYRHPKLGSWVDVVARTDSRYITVTNAPQGQEIPSPPFLLKIQYSAFRPEQMLRELQDYRNEGFIAISPEEFVEEFESLYAREMAWQKAHGAMRIST